MKQAGTTLPRNETYGTNGDDVVIWELVSLLVDVNVTLRDALEGSVVNNPSMESAGSLPMKFGWSNGNVHRRHC